jgi:tetratricopeptide (TPR) repeat protein
MKTKYIYIILIFLFAGFTSIIIHYRKPEVKLELKMRQGEMASSSEWQNAKAAIESLINEVNTHPENMKAKLQLALAYIQESRISGEHAYYDRTAIRLLDEVLKKDPDNTDALCAKATVLLSQHHFADALPLAEKAAVINPYSSAVYGIMTDAYVELGKYNEAVKTADKMVSVRPDLRSYSRVSYLREIFGNYPGAIEAMKLAVSAGYPGLEQSAWTRTYLGRLYEMTGDLPNAQMHYEITLAERPNYAFALSGLGRIEKAKGNYSSAISYFEKAKTQLKDFSFDEELTELYRISNQPQKATNHANETIAALSSLNDKNGNAHGHYADRELANAYLDNYKYTFALTHALIEYNRRPDNIDVNQTLAWVHYKRGEYADAERYISVAMRTGSKNPVLLYQAGLIAMKSGHRQQGIAWINEALQLNPFISPLLKWEGKNYLAEK